MIEYDLLASWSADIIDDAVKVLASWSTDIIDDSMKAIVIFCSDIPFWPALGGTLTALALLMYFLLFKK